MTARTTKPGQSADTDAAPEPGPSLAHLVEHAECHPAVQPVYRSAAAVLLTVALQRAAAHDEAAHAHLARRMTAYAARHGARSGDARGRVPRGGLLLAGHTAACWLRDRLTEQEAEPWWSTVTRPWQDDPRARQASLAGLLGLDQVIELVWGAPADRAPQLATACMTLRRSLVMLPRSPELARLDAPLGTMTRLANLGRGELAIPCGHLAHQVLTRALRERRGAALGAALRTALREHQAPTTAKDAA